MRPLRVLALCLTAAPAAALGAHPLPVETASRASYARRYGAGAELHVERAFFDRDGVLRWNGERVSSAGGCSPDMFGGGSVPATARCERSTVMLGPRVDACTCTAPTPTGTRSAVVYIGLDASSQERWRRQHRSLERRSGPVLVGAHPAGLVFEDQEVWAPETGLTLRAGSRGAHVSSPSCYLPERDAFLEFSADVTLVRTRGGLYLRGRDGSRELVLPVERRIVGHYDVEDLAPVPGTSLVLLAERFQIRGPGSVRFTVLDLASREVVFRDEHDRGHLTAAARVTVGSGGHVGLSFLDEHGGEYVVVHYRLSR